MKATKTSRIWGGGGARVSAARAIACVLPICYIDAKTS